MIRRIARFLPPLLAAAVAGCAHDAAPRPEPRAEPRDTLREMPRDAIRAEPLAEISPRAPAETPAAPPESGWIVLSPGLRIDRTRSLLEFDGVVSVDCHNPTTPDVYLELVACSPDTREHESLVVTAVPPSLIHAGLLALGFEPGRPGGVVATDAGIRREAPSGDPLSVELVADGRSSPASSWITDVRTRREHPPGGWIFTGSRIVERGGERVYDADGTGTIIGLTTFGSETIAYSRPISPDSWVDDPLWIADAGAVPARGTPVIVRLGRARPDGPRRAPPSHGTPPADPDQPPSSR